MPADATPTRREAQWYGPLGSSTGRIARVVRVTQTAAAAAWAQGVPTPPGGAGRLATGRPVRCRRRAVGGGQGAGKSCKGLATDAAGGAGATAAVSGTRHRTVHRNQRQSGRHHHRQPASPSPPAVHTERRQASRGAAACDRRRLRLPASRRARHAAAGIASLGATVRRRRTGALTRLRISPTALGLMRSWDKQSQDRVRRWRRA